MIDPNDNYIMCVELEKIGWNYVPATIRDSIIRTCYVKDFKDIRGSVMACIDAHSGQIEINGTYNHIKNGNISALFSSVGEFIEIANKYDYKFEKCFIYCTEEQND